MSNDMSYKGLGLSLHGRTWRAQKRIRKSCIDAYQDGGQVLYLNIRCADKKEAASIARQWIARLEAEFDRIEHGRAQIRTTITDGQGMGSGMRPVMPGTRNLVGKSCAMIAYLMSPRLGLG